MLERILTVARLESGQHRPKFQLVLLNDVVDNVLHDAHFEAAGADATIYYPGGVDTPVSGDPNLLRSAVENIVRNAIFYSGKGGKIDILLRHENNSAVLSVRDNGPGVPEQALPLLFKAFYRVDDARGTTTGCMGLGLAIVRNAVAAHGGVVTARNVLPHGLEVEIRMPLAVVAPTARVLESKVNA
jgi:signal transduction histidine kinase